MHHFKNNDSDDETLFVDVVGSDDDESSTSDPHGISVPRPTNPKSEIEIRREGKYPQTSADPLGNSPPPGKTNRFLFNPFDARHHHYQEYLRLRRELLLQSEHSLMYSKCCWCHPPFLTMLPFLPVLSFQPLPLPIDWLPPRPPPHVTHSDQSAATLCSKHGGDERNWKSFDEGFNGFARNVCYNRDDVDHHQHHHKQQQQHQQQQHQQQQPLGEIQRILHDLPKKLETTTTFYRKIARWQESEISFDGSSRERRLRRDGSSSDDTCDSCLQGNEEKILDREETALSKYVENHVGVSPSLLMSPFASSTSSKVPPYFSSASSDSTSKSPLAAISSNINSGKWFSNSSCSTSCSSTSSSSTPSSSSSFHLASVARHRQSPATNSSGDNRISVIRKSHLSRREEDSQRRHQYITDPPKQQQQQRQEKQRRSPQLFVTGSVHSVASVSPRQPICSICKRSFSSSSALQIHQRTHSGIKPFSCNACGKAFSTKGNLKVHLSAVHRPDAGRSRRGQRLSLSPERLRRILDMFYKNKCSPRNLFN